MLLNIKGTNQTAGPCENQNLLILSQVYLKLYYEVISEVNRMYLLYTYQWSSDPTAFAVNTEFADGRYCL